VKVWQIAKTQGTDISKAASTAAGAILVEKAKALAAAAATNQSASSANGVSGK